MKILITDPSPVGRVLLSSGGVVLEQVADWLPVSRQDRPAPLTGQQPLPLELAEEGPRGAGAAGPPPRWPGRQGAEASAAAVTGVILECLAGRRPAGHLRILCAEQALSQVRRWPRGPGWARAAVIGVPHTRLAEATVDAVVLIELSGHRLAMALCLDRSSGKWLVDDARLLVTPGLEELLAGG